jgi:diguanylate cyclase (GGDEF)-like protein/PAS domain S-box-containing protein
VVVDTVVDDACGAGSADPTSMLSADRMRLLHATATLANEATTLEEIASRLLQAACAGLGFRAGALLHWRDAADPGAATVVAQHGPVDLAPTHCAPPPTGGISTCADGSVLVALPPREARPQAWWFARDHGRSEPAPDVRQCLAVLALQASRVVEREKAAAMLRQSEERFRSVFHLSPLPMGLTLGETGTYGAVNQAMCELVGRPASELVGMSAKDIVHPDDVPLTEPAGAAALAAPDGRHTVALRLLRSDGAVVHTVVSLAWINGPDGTLNLLAQVEDITARRTAEEMLRRQAQQDGLTGLANRACLAHALADAGASRTPCSLLFIDLDGFKLINDMRGHESGDQVLVEVARRLQTVTAPTDLVARFGGDEFVVLSPDRERGGLLPARALAERIGSVLAGPVATGEGTTSVSASIGIAWGVVDPTRPQELVQRADTAMYHAKLLGKDRCEVYDSDLHEQTVAHQRTEAALRHALEDDRFVVHHQPIVRLEDGCVVGFEALVRLRDEHGRLVPPGRFLPVAEQSGLVVPMGAWVLRESCRTVARLRRETGRPLTTSVNLAPRQAARPDLLDTVSAALADACLPPEALVLELTESALLEADRSTLGQLLELRQGGVGIALDDFGTGYSSLTYLRRLPVSHLKVDRSFVQGMVTSRSDRAIVRAVTGLADDLGLGWVAEGIETPQQRDAVQALGRGYGQGFLFGRPVAAGLLRAAA